MKVAILICSIVLFILFALNSNSEYVLRVHVLDVGQGDAIFIQLPDGDQLLIDAGRDNTAVYEMGAQMPFGDMTIEQVFVTHGDFDHYGGIFGVSDKYYIDAFFDSGLPGSRGYEALKRSQNITAQPLKRGDVFRWSSGVEMEVLWPDSASTENTNDTSLVMLVSWGTTSFLFTGDAGVSVERAILNDVHRVTVLKAGHHGSKTSSDPDFVHHISPHWCVISAGADNSYGHPHDSVITTFMDNGCEIISTIEEGTITFESNGLDVWLKN